MADGTSIGATKLPWKVYAPYGTPDCICDRDNMHVASCEDAEAAALIVEAVNSFDANREALAAKDERIAKLEAVAAADLNLLDHCAHLLLGASINPKRDIHGTALELRPLMDDCYAARAALAKAKAVTG